MLGRGVFRKSQRTAYLSASNGKLFLTLLALCGLIVFQPRMPLLGSEGENQDIFLFNSNKCTVVIILIFYLECFVNFLEVLHFKFRPLTKTTTPLRQNKIIDLREERMVKALILTG